MEDPKKRRKHLKKARSSLEHGTPSGAGRRQKSRRSKSVARLSGLEILDSAKDTATVEKVIERELLAFYWKSRERYAEGESEIPEKEMHKIMQDIQAKHGIEYVSPEISESITSNAMKRITDMLQA